MAYTTCDIVGSVYRTYGNFTTVVQCHIASRPSQVGSVHSGIDPMSAIINGNLNFFAGSQSAFIGARYGLGCSLGNEVFCRITCVRAQLGHSGYCNRRRSIGWSSWRSWRRRHRRSRRYITRCLSSRVVQRGRVGLGSDNLGVDAGEQRGQVGRGADVGSNGVQVSDQIAQFARRGFDQVGYVGDGGA